MKIISRGAEAIITEKSSKIVVKQRLKKGYRIEFLDEKIRKLRTRSEAKIIQKLAGIINVPKIIDVSENKKEIEMEFINGKKLSEYLDKAKNGEQICFEIGRQVGKMHDAGIIHGDLTTSNMILKSQEVYFIDFGLAFHSSRVEDKAVDLHLIKQALEAKHFLHFGEFFDKVIEGYKKSDKAQEVLKQFRKVEARGRYKSMI